MSLCDRCVAPGMCCRRINNISAEPPGETKLEALAWIASIEPAHGELGLPFLPVERENDRWVWTCPILTPDGRCGDYEHRPNLCRIFRPGVDDPCTMAVRNDRSPLFE